MANKWPQFVTADLGNSAADDLEMERRWFVYRDEMRALIAAGGVRQDEDGWWIDEASGELIGPDPDIESPFPIKGTVKSFAEAFPDQAEAIKKGRGRQKAPTKISTTIRLSPDVLDYFRAGGAGWQSRIDEALKEWVASR